MVGKCKTSRRTATAAPSIKQRIKIVVALLRADATLIDRVESLLCEAPKPEPQPYEPWFRRQSLNTFERQRAEREEREQHVQFRNHDWQPAMYSQWGQR